MKTVNQLFLVLCICYASFAVGSTKIAPYKYTDEERQSGSPKYDIPSESRFTTKRIGTESPDITYYFSKPSRDKFPIAILVGGSSSEDDMISIIHFHRYFLKEFLDLGIGVITIEQQGLDGDQINKTDFMEHYTRSNRLNDHRIVIEQLKKHPPLGQSGKLIFLGVSEGGLIVTTLTTDYPDLMLATINWSGAGDWSWRDELWAFIHDIIQSTSWFIKLRAQLPSWMPYSLNLYFQKSRKNYDQEMDKTIKNPTANLKFIGMTYQYHYDALSVYPYPAYEKIKTPYLIVTGAKDSIIDSSDAFAHKAKNAGAPITYMRVSDMDHYFRKREDIINNSFSWLEDQLKN